MAVDDVLRAEVGGLAVDDRDLAVVAQVQARGIGPPQPQRHHRYHLRTGSGESRSQALEPLARADGVGQHPHGDAPAGGAFQRGGDRLPGGVVLEDVIEEVNVAAGAVDVGDQPRDRRVVVGEEFEAVAVDGAKLRASLRKLEAGLPVHGRLPAGVGRCRRVRCDATDRLPDLALQREAPAREVRASDEEVERDARPRPEQDQQQPGARRCRRAPLRHQHQRRDAQHPLARDVERAPGCQVPGHGLAARSTGGRPLRPVRPDAALLHDGVPVAPGAGTGRSVTMCHSEKSGGCGGAGDTRPACGHSGNDTPGVPATISRRRSAPDRRRGRRFGVPCRRTPSAAAPSGCRHGRRR